MADSNDNPGVNSTDDVPDNEPDKVVPPEPAENQ